MGSTNEDAFQDDSTEHEDVYIVESFPVYVMESVAAGTAATFAKTVAAPLERVKILSQTRAHGFHSIGVCQSLKKMVQHEGLRGLYKGNGASVLRMYPHSAFRYMAYEQYRCLLLQNFPSVQKGPVLDILAGSAAGGTAFLCTYPLDLARTKLAYQVVDRRSLSNDNRCIHSSLPADRGIMNVFRTIKNRGIRAFYRGIGPTLGGILPYTGLKYLAYEELKRQHSDEHKGSVAEHLACGSLASLFGQTLTYPLDVVRRQMQGKVDIQHQGGSRYKNTVQGLVAIARNQGWRQLYAGASINYIKVIPSVVVCFTSFELMKYWLNLPLRQKC